MAATGGRGPTLRPPPPRSDTLEPDVVIGDFVRGEEIGKGSFATVYVAKHAVKKSFVAVKVVPQSKLNPKLKDNLNLEIKILKSMEHPHIVALFSCLETRSFFYLVMEYCHMSDLAQFMKKRRQLPNLPETSDIFRRYPNPQVGGLNEVLVRHFFKQVVSALQYLRKRNLIHRDIKPQNLLLNPAPIVMARQAPETQPLAASEHSLVPAVGVNSLPMLKIADFGFARHLPSTAMAETLCGSPLYMAPEILRYEKYDARADLWSTGTVLYEMVVGKPPFRAQNHVELLHKIEGANDVIAFDRHIPISRDMKTVVRRLLRRSPLDRITYEQLVEDPVVVNDIPNLVPEDRPPTSHKPEPMVSEISRRMASQNQESHLLNHTSSESAQSPPTTHRDISQAISRATENELSQRPTQPITRRKSSVSSPGHAETAPQDIRRQPSQWQQQARRPSIVAHMTAPGRQELQLASSPSPSTAQKIERRPSRSSPLSNPPMVREPSNVRNDGSRPGSGTRDRTVQDMMFEKEYVVIDKRAVEVNAFADELDANANMHQTPHSQGVLVRRATTQNPPSSNIGAQAISPRTTLAQGGRPAAAHQRAGSFERRYAPSPTSAANMLTNALKAANVRLFGALDTSSPPYAIPGPSPPKGYGAFPAYPVPQGSLLLGDGSEGRVPTDEDSKLLRVLEEAATRSDVIYSFAEVKYKQLVPATPSAQEGLGIQQIGVQTTDSTDEDKDMTITAIVGVAEEALVLYVKTLSILAKTIDLASHWWSKQSRGEILTSENATRSSSTETGKRMNSIVQWARNRFNECLEKSELVGRRLQMAQLELPVDHPSHPDRHATSSTGGGTSSSHIQITSGITAAKLMFERAVEMSRTAALAELVGERLDECEIGYRTSIMLLEAVLEVDDEPYMKRSTSKSPERINEGIVSGGEDGSKQSVLSLLEGARARWSNVRKKIAAQQAARRNSSLGIPKPPSSHGIAGASN